MTNFPMKCFEITNMVKSLCSIVYISLFYWYIRMKLSKLVKTPLNVGSLQPLVTNLSVLQQMVTSRNERKPSSSCSTLKFMLWCLEEIYSRKGWADSDDAKGTETSSIYLLFVKILQDIHCSSYLHDEKRKCWLIFDVEGTL